MTLNSVLLSLLESLGTTGDSHIVDWNTVQQWPAGALARMLECGILTVTRAAQSIECQGCENRCFMEVHQLPGTNKKPARFFVVCDDPEMQEQMGRIQIPQEKLQQWKVTPHQLAKVAANLLVIDNNVNDRHGHNNIRIGMIEGGSGRRWLSLNKSPLALEISENKVPLEEVLFFDDDKLHIDKTRIYQLMEKASGSTGKKYRPSTSKREARKRRTEAMYADWHAEYHKYRLKYPNRKTHSDNWIAKQIAKMKIAQGRDSETIRHNMKG